MATLLRRASSIVLKLDFSHSRNSVIASLGVLKCVAASKLGALLPKKYLQLAVSISEEPPKVWVVISGDNLEYLEI